MGFHRLLMPDGSTLRLDQFLGLNQIGDAGLRDKVNHHYWSTFGSAAAVGLISGLAQWIGTAGFRVERAIGRSSSPVARTRHRRQAFRS